MRLNTCRPTQVGVADMEQVLGYVLFVNQAGPESAVLTFWVIIYEACKMSRTKWVAFGFAGFSLVLPKTLGRLLSIVETSEHQSAAWER